MPTFDFAKRVENYLPDRPLTEVPNRPGLYLLFDEAGRVRRMGSTRDLRARARYYLHEREESGTLSVARRESAAMGWLPTFSRFETQLAHLRLYRAYFPEAVQSLYRLSSPTLLRVTMGEAYPRLYAVRDLKSPEHRHVGPYLHRDMAESEAKLVTDLLELRRCDYLIVPNEPYERCLYLQMGSCVAPCDTFAQAAYYALAEQAMTLLGGDIAPLNATLVARRDEAAAALEFEAAMRWRDAARRLTTWAEQRPPFLRPIDHLDLVVPQPTDLGLDLFLFHAGHLVGWERLPEPTEDGLAHLLAARYAAPPPDPVWPGMRDDLAFLSRWLWDRDYGPYVMVEEPEQTAAQLIAYQDPAAAEIDEEGDVTESAEE